MNVTAPIFTRFLPETGDFCWLKVNYRTGNYNNNKMDECKCLNFFSIYTTQSELLFFQKSENTVNISIQNLAIQFLPKFHIRMNTTYLKAFSLFSQDRHNIRVSHSDFHISVVSCKSSNRVLGKFTEAVFLLH